MHSASRMNLSLRIPALFTVCMLYLDVLHAQTAERIYPLEEVEIISDRLGHTAARTGRHTTVITGEDIHKLPVHSLDDLLRYIPFLETHARGAYGVQSDILMRGGTFNQVLVLLDGMRINDPLTGHFNSYIPVSLEEISRIEVYRGPASSLYGPDAVGGVIHIITKSFLPGEGSDHLEGRVESWYGQHNLFRLNPGIHVRKGRLKLGAGVSFNRSDGHALEPDSLRGDFRLLTASASAAYRITENMEAGLRTAYDNRLFNARYFYTSSPLDMSREHIEKWWNQAFFRYRLNSSNTLTLQAALQSTADSFLFNPMFPANTHITRYHNYQASHQYISPSGLRLSAGLQADRKMISSSDRGNHVQWHSGAYVVLSDRIRRQGTMSGGIRMDYNPVYGLEVLPQVNISWPVDRWNFRGAAGRSVRAPDFTEQYISTGLPGPVSPGRNLGNPWLLAERSWSLEAGVDRSLLDGVQLTATAFYRFSRDLIDYSITVSEDIENNHNLIPGESYFYAGNTGLLNTIGLEAQLEGIHNLSGAMNLQWGLACQALRSRSAEGLATKYLSAHARNMVHAGMGLSGNSGRIQLTSLYKKRDAAAVAAINESIESGYFLLNLRADAFLLEKRLMLSLQVNNLLDRSYSEVLGAKMPGRWIAGGITWKFTGK